MRNQLLSLGQACNFLTVLQFTICAKLMIALPGVCSLLENNVPASATQGKSPRLNTSADKMLERMNGKQILQKQEGE